MTKKYTLPLDATKQRLAHWAYWYDRELLGHLDPDRFILMSELMAEHRVYLQRHVQWNFANHHGSITNHLINQYFQEDAFKAMLLKRHFFNFERTTHEKIVRTGLKRSTYFHYLQQGIRWIESHWPPTPSLTSDDGL